jgi:uncharacterized protein (TIGR03435 family)
MKKLVVLLAAAVALCGTGARAQDLSGNWQGTLHWHGDRRVIVKFAKGAKDGWTAKIYNPDDGEPPIDATSVVKQGDEIKLSVDFLGAVFLGKLGADGTTLAGDWTESRTPQPMPIVFVKATSETAWEIAAPPPPPKMLPEDADPSFAVATIKPDVTSGIKMRGPGTDGHEFKLRNGSLGDLISFAYDVQANEIIGGPSWMDQDRYDIEARQDVDGLANDKQLRAMVRKLIEDRFQIKIHHDKRDLSAFLLTVAKGGPKLTPSQSKGDWPGTGYVRMPGGVVMEMYNGTVDDLADYLQSAIVDRPVVDHTGIAGRFDMTVKFTPDNTQFKGHPPNVRPGPDTTEVAPSLFEAMERQAGLKLSPGKADVGVVVIDHVEKPSAN